MIERCIPVGNKYDLVGSGAGARPSRNQQQDVASYIIVLAVVNPSTHRATDTSSNRPPNFQRRPSYPIVSNHNPTVIRSSKLASAESHWPLLQQRRQPTSARQRTSIYPNIHQRLAHIQGNMLCHTTQRLLKIHQMLTLIHTAIPHNTDRQITILVIFHYLREDE